MKGTRQCRLAGALAPALAWAALAAAGPTRAADPADKSWFTLFHPTPEALLRELNTDRPDQTEGPITVDAGHFQLELDLVSYAYDRETSGTCSRSSDCRPADHLQLDAGVNVGVTDAANDVNPFLGFTWRF